MSKGAIKKSTAQAICDAVKVKEGTTEGVPFKDVAERILALPTPSGVNKLAQLAEGTLTEITADDLAGATKLSAYCFYQSTLGSIELPTSVKTIELGGIYSCPNLTSLTLNEGLEIIRKRGVSFLEGLSELTIPSTVKYIESYGISDIGPSYHKTTYIFLPITPPTLEMNVFYGGYKIIVPKGCGEAYKSATNWANHADYIEEAAE